MDVQVSLVCINSDSFVYIAKKGIAMLLWPTFLGVTFTVILSLVSLYVSE